MTNRNTLLIRFETLRYTNNQKVHKTIYEKYKSFSIIKIDSIILSLNFLDFYN